MTEREYGQSSAVSEPARPAAPGRRRRRAEPDPTTPVEPVSSLLGQLEAAETRFPENQSVNRPTLRPAGRTTAPTSQKRPAAPIWGDRGSFQPRTIGKRSRAAEVPWQLTQGYDVPDTVLDGGRHGQLEVRAASTRGTSHRCDGAVRQDVCGLLSHPEGYLLAAVADGLGSAPDSHRGAALAVAHSLDYLSWALERDRLADVDPIAAIDAADRAIRAAGPRPQDRASTLAVLVLNVESYRSRHEFRAARVGDSSAFVLSEGRFREAFCVSRGPDVHETTTTCLPNRRGAVEVIDGRLEPGQALILVTDGVGIPLTVPEISGYLAESWSEPPGPVEFLHTLQFRARSFDDDRSAVAIWASKVDS